MDGSRDGFTVEEQSATLNAGDSITLHYSGAKAREYVSALFFDQKGDVRGCAGTLVSGEAGTVTFKIPKDVAPGAYTLRVFSEQRNGSYENDYASAPVDVSVAVQY